MYHKPITRVKWLKKILVSCYLSQIWVVAANFWLNPYSKATGNLHHFPPFKLIDFHICV